MVWARLSWSYRITTNCDLYWLNKIWFTSHLLAFSITTSLKCLKLLTCEDKDRNHCIEVFLWSLTCMSDTFPAQSLLKDATDPASVLCRVYQLCWRTYRAGHREPPFKQEPVTFTQKYIFSFLYQKSNIQAIIEKRKCKKRKIWSRD